jgi:hypothetical protein
MEGRERDQGFLKPWHLPVAVMGIAIPIIGATMLGGAPAGMGAAFLVAATIVVIAARARPDEPIEVVRAGVAGGHVLVLACTSIDAPVAVDTVVEAVEASASRTAHRTVEVLVVAPAFIGRLAQWLSDLEAARIGAQERLAVSLAGLAAAGLDARGRVGDSDPLIAAEDALRSYPADQLVFITDAGDERSEAAASAIRRRSPLPIRHVALAGEPVG